MVVYANFRKDIFIFEGTMASETSKNILLHNDFYRR